MSLTVKNISRGPLPLEGGRVLARGETAENVVLSDHTSALLADGALLDITPTKPAAKAKE